MDPLAAYLPIDRRQAMARGLELRESTHGTALFADISGFTPLTESLLAALGPQRGAEELSRHLNAVFDTLIAEVDQYGGTVLAFSGDAITCWFEGQAGRRAATCAVAMQAGMRPFGTLTLSSGAQTELAMKIALATGPARRVVVGDPAIQYLDVLAGATLERMAEAEHQAQPGEILLDNATLAQLGQTAALATAETAASAPFAVLSGMKPRARTHPWPEIGDNELSDDMLRPWLLPPIYTRLRDGQAQFLAEIRSGVALFMSFGGIDYDGDPGAGRKLDAYVCSVQQVLRKYEAFVLQLSLGDKGCYLYAAFGAPVAHDDDPLRAAAAAEELHALKGSFDYIHDVRIGLNQGRVWCGAYGGRTRHTYGALGDMVNVAARLMSRASPGETLLSPSVARSLELHYGLHPMGALKLKGKAEPLATFRLGRSLGMPANLLKSTEHSLVGRQLESAWLRERWQAVEAGRRGQVIRVIGARGVGKSHLVQEFAIEAANRGALVGVGVCHSTEQFIVYRPWRSILLRLLDVRDAGLTAEEEVMAAQAALGTLNPAWKPRAPLLGDVLGFPVPENAVTAALDPQLRREATWALVVEIISLLAERRPLLLWLDNVHDIDESSRALALAVSRTVERTRVMILCTQDPLLRDEQDPYAEWANWPNYAVLTLAPLTDNDVATLIQDRLGGQVRPLAMSLFQRQAQGNAFYAGELAMAMRERGLLEQREDGDWYLSRGLFELLQSQHCLARRTEDSPWTLAPDAVFSAEALGLPDSLQRTITARMDQLPPDVQLTLKTASVTGPLFELEILSLVHPRYPGRESLEKQLLELERRGLVRVVAERALPACMFEHNLIQEGIYSSLLVEQQTELHAAVGGALEESRREAVEQLAYHYSRSSVRDKALLFLGLAGDRARRSYANETALKYYELALALEVRWPWLKAQAEVLGVLGRRVEQRAALVRLEAAAGAPAFEVAFQWGQYYVAVCDYDRAQEELGRARNIAREHYQLVNEAESLTQLGLVAYRCGRYASAQQWFEQAQTVFPARVSFTLEEARPLAQAANGLGLVRLQQGDYADAEPHFQRALEIYRQSGDQRGEAQALSNLGSAAYQQRHLSGAQTFHEQALKLRRAIGDRAGQGSSLLNLATAARDSGDYGQAEAWFESALQIQRETGNRWDEVNTWNDLGILHEELGNLQRARECLQRGLAVSTLIGDEAGRAYVLSNLGLVLFDQGDTEAATTGWLEGLALARDQQDKALESGFLSYLGELCWQTGDYAGAADYAAQALALRQAQGRSALAVDDLCTLALVELARGDMPGALVRAREALDALQACQGEGPERPQRDYWACYRVLEAGGDAGGGRAALRAAYDWVLARAGRISDPALRQSFLKNAPRNKQVLESAQRVLMLDSETP